MLVVIVLAGWLLLDSFSARPPAPASPDPATHVAGSPAPSATPIGQPGSPTPDPAPARPSPTPAAQPPDPTASPPPSPGLPVGEVEMAFVPVVGFWSTEASITSDELSAVLAGDSRRFARVIVPTDDRAALASALGVAVALSVEDGDAQAISRAVRDGALGIMRVVDVTPAVRALSVDGLSLFGNDRLATLDGWPLRALVHELAAEWEQPATWTLAAAGDILLDRGVANQITTLGKGVDFPFDGGTVSITSIDCCSSFGWPVPTYERTGNGGAVRRLLSDADVAIANLETAVLPGARPSRGGLRFVAHPRTLDGLVNAGFDFMSLANNHIHNGGEEGVLTAMRELDARGIAHAGAGRTPRQAREPAVLEANGQRVAILGCTWVGRRFAQAGFVGANDCRDGQFVDEIRDASSRVDVLIVFPHWGREYQADPRPYQRRLAAEWIDAGADLVIGAHSHWAGAIEEIDGKLVFYSLGNFVFDQSWSLQTMQGLVIELTFHGDELVQAWLHPVLILDQAQPNLLETVEDRRRVLDQMRDGSAGLLDY